MLPLESQAEKATKVLTFLWFPFKVKVHDNVNRPEDEEEVVFDENEEGDDDEADVDGVSLVCEYEFCPTSLGLTVPKTACTSLAMSTTQ